MTSRSPLWPAQLDHIRIDSDDPAKLAEFYRDALGMTPSAQNDGICFMQGPQRRLLIGPGQRGAQPLSAFRVQTHEQLGALRDAVRAKGVELLESPTPVFGDNAFAVRDPDERLVAFGLPRAVLPTGDRLGGAKPEAAALPGRLQHVVVATNDLTPMLEFYQDVLGFVPSDHVYDSTNRMTTCFFRSDPEHHSFAVFLANEARPDHHCYETTCWNDIRDWADHLAARHIQLWWGPGRHGPGNNLFFMVPDPQGYLFEISAELELMPYEMKPRSWEHTERSLNLWGKGWLRN